MTAFAVLTQDSAEQGVFVRASILICAVLLNISCANRGSGDITAVVATNAVAPRGVTVGPRGYATIIDVPSALFSPVAPGEPAPPTAQDIAAQEQFQRASQFQNEVRDEAQALAGKLRTKESGNFVDPVGTRHPNAVRV